MNSKEYLDILFKNMNLIIDKLCLQGEISSKDKQIKELEKELNVLYKRIELLKLFCKKKKIKLRDGKQGFDCYCGVDAVISIINGTSNFAKLDGLKDYEDVEVLE